MTEREETIRDITAKAHGVIYEMVRDLPFDESRWDMLTMCQEAFIRCTIQARLTLYKKSCELRNVTAREEGLQAAADVMANRAQLGILQGMLEAIDEGLLPDVGRQECIKAMRVWEEASAL